MKGYRRTSTVWQMSAAVCAFVLVGLVLESGALVDWAERLELGPERTVALPVVMALHDRVQRLGVERVREQALVELARVGWSDDPVALARTRPQKKLVLVNAAPVAMVKPPVTLSSAEPNAVAAALAVGDAKPAVKDSSPSAAASTTSPLAVSAPPKALHLPPMAAVPAGKVRTVALTGDSMMAVGLASTILRQAPQYKDLELVKAFKSGTGLARPEVFDWTAEYPAMLGGTKPDVVVVAIGANDGQGFVDGGVTYPFGSAGWQTIYRARVRSYLDMLEADGATVVWLGLPPMKSDAYDARTQLVNRIDYAVVSASPHAVWFSTTGLFGDAAGRFEDYGSVRGVPARLRQEDGIHISDAGGVLVADKLLPWLDGRK